ncbi:MAG: TMEM198/TM7SF3 family protein [Lentisphaeraceae bacterium]|nr:TMEM198/TM7SF3 family protein [Lentisphaeraceae bacterium]
MEKLFAGSGLVAIMLCSLIYCFFGYRFFKLLLGLSGALIFASLSWLGFQKFAPEMQMPAIIISLICGLIGAWFFHKAFKVAAFIYGAAAGVTLSPAIRPFINSPEPWIEWALPIGCALVGGVLLLISRRIILIIMTAASGAIYFTMSLFTFLIQINVFEKTITESPNTFHSSMWLLSFSLCFFSGLFCQFSDKEAKN